MLHLLLAAILVPSLSTSAGTTPGATPAKGGASAAARRGAEKPEPLGVRSVQADALALEEAVRDGDAQAFERAVAWETLIDHAGDRVSAVAATRKAFRDAAFEAIHAFSADVVGTVRCGGSFRCVGVDETANGVRATFRLVRDEGSGFDRITLHYDKKGIAGAPATDVECALDAAPYSKKLRRLFLIAASEAKDIAPKLRGSEALVARHAAQITAARDAFASGANRNALDVLSQLPAEVENDPELLVLRLCAARAVSDDAFTTALEHARKAAPGVAAFEMLAFDQHLLHGRTDAALASLASLGAPFEGDAWLDHLASRVWRERGDLSKARELCRRSIERESSLEDPYWTLFEIFAEENRFDDAVAIARSINASFDVDWRAIESASHLAPLWASDAWSRWRATVASRR